MLVALVVDPGRLVAITNLLDLLWDGAPPPSARTSLHGYVMRLRRVFDEVSGAGGGAVSLHHRGGGYQIDIDPDRVDIHQFRRLVRRSRVDGCPLPERARLLRAALNLWRGDPFGDIPGVWASSLRTGLIGERLDAVIAWARAELGDGNHEAVIGELRTFTAVYPLAEPLVVALIEALRSAGRIAEALEWYETMRRLLADELGADPGPELQLLHRELLRGEPATVNRGRARSVVPAQLPLDVHRFSGRTEELAWLDAVISAGEPTAAAVVTLSGTAGVGKTAVAVHWAHRVASRFADGQLYVDLRGFGRGEAMDSAEAIRGFLDALGVEPHHVPPGPDAQAALYRSLSADRRLLVVLDNASDADQVRPLLAAGPAVRTVITSRDLLTALVAEVGARSLVLNPPEPAEAIELLNRRIGVEPESPEDSRAAAAIVAACGRLPLALALVAARVSQTGFPLAALAAELRRPDLAALHDLRAVFASSYRTLSPTAARMFRLLGLVGSDDIATPAVAALASVDIPMALRTLRELTERSMLVERQPGRYQMHDLLRVHAGELASVTETDASRRAALTRLLDHYTHTAYEAELVLNPTRSPIPIQLGTPADEIRAKQSFDAKAALEWLGTERAVLLSALRQAKDEGLDRHAWQLGWALDTFLSEHRRWHDEGAAWAIALNAATALRDRPAAAHAHRFLAVVAGRLDRFDEAHAHIRDAVSLSREARDRPGEAEAHFVLSYVCWLQADPDRALAHAHQSLALWTELRSAGWEGKASNAVGWYHLQMGANRAAVPYFERALVLQRRVGDRANEAVARDNLGQAHHNLGHHEAAADHHDHARRMARDVADPMMEAQFTVHLADAYQTMGHHATARKEWQAAYQILADVGHPQAADVRRKLDTAPSSHSDLV